MVIFEGGGIIATERHLDEAEMAFIRDMIKNYTFDMSEIDVCDGDAWQFEGPDYCFDLGYIYGTDLEKTRIYLEMPIRIVQQNL